MITLVVTVFLVVTVSALCSTMEAALYATPWTAIERLRKEGSSSGQLLFAMRSNIDKPISAILTLNTVANTAGAAMAGALAAPLIGEHGMPWFAAFLTLLILAFGEILPKTLGVLHAVFVAKTMALPLSLLMRLLSPVIRLLGLLTRLFAPAQGSAPSATEDDIRAITSLSRQSGGIQPYEESTIRNILALDRKRVHDIMTPRTVIFSLPETMTVAEAYNLPQIWEFSRIPVYEHDNEDIVGIVERRRISQCFAAGETDVTLSRIMQPVRFVPESQTVDKLLQEFLEVRRHLFVVLDEYGGLAGVVSLEDVLEEMLGREIVDESDTVDDMRELARQRRKALSKKAVPSD